MQSGFIIDSDTGLRAQKHMDAAFTFEQKNKVAHVWSVKPDDVRAFRTLHGVTLSLRCLRLRWLDRRTCPVRFSKQSQADFLDVRVPASAVHRHGLRIGAFEALHYNLHLTIIQ
jgi:hypothetical protein